MLKNNICNILLLMLLLGYNLVQAQEKTPLDHTVYEHWHSIENRAISADGKIVIYELEPGLGDSELMIHDLTNNEKISFARGSNGMITFDSKHVIFKVKPHLDTLKAKRRIKIKEKKLPKDSLFLYQVSIKQLTKIPRVKSFKTPKKAGGWLAYQLEPSQIEDTTLTRKESEENGYKLILRDLETSKQDTFHYVTDYLFAEEGNSLLLHSHGDDSLFLPGVYRFDLNTKELQPLMRGSGEYKQLSLNKEGSRAAFLVDQDTVEKRLIKYFSLFHWHSQLDSARKIIDTTHQNLPKGWILNQHHGISFADDDSKLFFNIYPKPVLQDTTLLPEEIVSVEIWNYQDQYLQTQQEVEKEEEQKKGYLSVYHFEEDKMVPIATKEIPNVHLSEKKNATVALAYTNKPYGKLISWEGFPPYHDIYLVDLQTGNLELIQKKVKGYPRLSNMGKYIYWYSVKDTAWFSYNTNEKTLNNLSRHIPTQIYDELHDYPDYPDSYGIAGWTKDDQHILIYDRYDIWKIDPENPQNPVNITQNGRVNQLRYRYLHLDPDERSINEDQPLYLQVFNQKSKGEGYYRLDWQRKNDQAPQELYSGSFLLSNLHKARNNDQVIFSRETFQEFPDIIYSSLQFQDPEKLSNANPQQNNYWWGSSELINWISHDGKKLEGILVKPENFDPQKKYPLLVNFYERSSDRLHAHRAPYPGRSTIPYSFYASRGYVIFNPDVPYTPGYPGESAYNAVIPGITRLIGEGFIDKDNIGVQGHSWGGYQVSYLITRTDIFKAAEAGAPVSNMISAYGGIRWETGLSRMFQYEHTQSRIGGTPWEYPLRYIENSPIFFVDKINTPLLIMHNDKDGHVPWYQGIELFVSMRRLNKPCWMLNYNEEPHWPLDYQLRVDFNIRMQQYFDHYLQGKPAPEWMKEGIPATEKGVNLGYETME